MIPTVSYHKQLTISDSVTVTPAGLRHTEYLAIGGVARTLTIVVQTPAKEVSELRLNLVFENPAISGILCDIFKESDPTTPVISFTTDGVQPNAVFEFLLDGVGGLELISQQIPAVLS